jgi:hypothetical protein
MFLGFKIPISDSRLLQYSEVEKIYVLFLEQNGWGNAGRTVQ